MGEKSKGIGGTSFERLWSFIGEVCQSWLNIGETLAREVTNVCQESLHRLDGFAIKDCSRGPGQHREQYSSCAMLLQSRPRFLSVGAAFR